MRTRLSQNHTAGLTLIELMVVIAIVGIVSSVIMFNYGSFNTNVSVRNLAQDIALSIRKAQSYATSVQLLKNSSTSSYGSYGIAFSLADSSPNTAEPSKKQFILFADINQDGHYDAGATCGNPSATNGECLESFAITGADTITKLCTSTDGINPNCATANSSVVMEFCRPAPDATIYLNGDADTKCALKGITFADVVIQSAKGLTQTIRLWNTGQISVQ